MMFFESLKKNNSGFTLAEIMVVVSIVVIVNSMVFLGNRTLNTARNVQMSAYRVASEIRKMQSYTLNLQSFHNGKFPDGGWGVYFSKAAASNDKVISYADGHSAQATHFYDSGEQYVTTKLPNGVKIKDLKVDDNMNDANPAVSVNDLHLNFEPPEPKTYICSGTDTDGLYAEIIISDDLGENESKVKINSYGLIDVE